jgi:chlorobactene glucosyltransferase
MVGAQHASRPLAGVVLSLRDEAANVDGVLASLLAQDHPAFNVTVIDDGSVDATPHALAI